MRAVLCLALCLFFLPAAAAPPQAADEKRVSAASEPLSTLLPRLRPQVGLQLTAAPSLANQRITLYGEKVDRGTIVEGLKRLLSAPPDGPVFWSGSVQRGRMRLEESRRRKEIADALRESSVDEYFAWLEGRMAWAVREGPGLVDRAARSGKKYAALGALETVGPFGLLSGLGKENLATLRRGDPVWVRLGELTGGDAARLGRSWLEMKTGQRDRDTGRPKNPVGVGANEWAAGAEEWLIVIMLEEVSGDPRRLQFGSVMVWDPRGSRRWGHLSPRLSRATGQLDAFVAPVAVIDRMGAQPAFGFERPLPDEREDEPRVSFDLAPPGPETFPVKVAMHELLDRLSRASGVTIMADGYLRPHVRILAGTGIKDVPLRRILTRISEYWACDWSWLDAKEDTALIRSRAWAFEDVADVPPATVARLKSKLDGSRIPDIEDLVELAELTQPQIRKLTVETGLCPAGTHLLSDVMNVRDGAGRNLLLLYKALTPAMQRRARTEAGTDLAGLSPALVQTRLLPALITGGGLVLPEWYNQLSRLRIVERRVEGKDGDVRWSYTFHIDTGVERGIRCSVDIRGLVPGRTKKPDPPRGLPRAPGGLPAGVTLVPPTGPK